MNTLISKLKTLKYSSSKEHEKSVEKILIELGIKYTYQPNGTQRPPDFYIPEYNLNLECKSSMNKIPMWNSSYPETNTLYIFSSKKDNVSHVFYGSEIMNEDIKKIYEEYSSRHKKLQEEMNIKLKGIESNKYDMKVYARNMYVQGRGFENEQKINTNENKKLGQYFTTSPLILEKLLNDYNQNPKNILEPSSGVGNILGILNKFDCNIDAIDIDERLTQLSKKSFPNVNHYTGDFLYYETNKFYDLIIGNPPYFEINKKDVPSYFDDIIFGRPNIYYLFIYKCINLLNIGGELRFVIPKAFLSNKYALKCREYIISKCEIIDIEYFQNPNLFDKATQSVVILKLKRTRDGSSVDNKHILKINNSILFVKDNKQIELTNHTISSLGCKVKTGNIVWNINKEIITDRQSSDTLPLIFSSNLLGNCENRYLKVTGNNKKYLINQDCILIQRIVSGKIVCKFIEANNSGFFVENHINVITGERLILLKIYASLCSEKTINFASKVFSNTQISQHELENILQIYEV